MLCAIVSLPTKVVDGVCVCTPPPSPTLARQTRGLIANGGTSVGAGLRMAQRVLQERVHRNPVAAVMVLSDGCDSGGCSPCGPVATSLRDAGVSVHTWG